MIDRGDIHQAIWKPLQQYRASYRALVMVSSGHGADGHSYKIRKQAMRQEKFVMLRNPDYLRSGYHHRLPVMGC